MQSSLEFSVRFAKEAYAYGSRADGGTHGVVLTKPHVVQLILDLAGYTSDRDLSALRVLEPSCGHGAFLLPAVERLIASARQHGKDIAGLGRAITSFDIDEANVAHTRTAIIQTLSEQGIDHSVASGLAVQWVQCADYLLEPLSSDFDIVVGNPPYIRIEQLSPELQVEYRRRFATLFDRADLYVAFIERSLHLLSPQGVLSFVCADRWTLNKYGAPLRELIAARFELRTYVDLHKASPFESEVIAYPSIFVIGREKTHGATKVASLAKASPGECGALVAQIRGGGASHEGVELSEYPVWFANGEPWVLSSPGHLALLRELEGRLPALEASGGNTSVRIGVASGNDSIYIVSSEADIEQDRLVPLVMRDDMDAGTVKNGHRFIINTFEPNGAIELENYPRLRRYLLENEGAIKRRHVAQKRQDWFRTIDRVYPELVSKPKLLIPDIAGANEVVFEAGHYYPHHNLYFIISDVWEMEVLGGLLSSRVALFFVWSYAVKMRGGYLRFQAQYLRRIRVPRPESLSLKLQNEIKCAFRARNFAELDELSRIAYGLDELPSFDFVDTRR